MARVLATLTQRLLPCAVPAGVTQRHLPRAFSAGARYLSDGKPLAARVATFVNKYMSLEVRLDRSDKSAVVDAVIGLVKAGELTVEQVMERLPEHDASAVEQLAVLPTDGLRFELGRVVECRLGLNDWARGKVIGHYYRETDWPEGQKAPYQVLLDGDEQTARTIWAPADSDDCIRAAVRFDVGADVECCVGVDTWARGTVVAHFYREPEWPMQLLAPYRVLLENASIDGRDEVYIWAPLDSDECIRQPSIDRAEVLPVEEGA